jgi:hypothetical protein
MEFFLFQIFNESYRPQAFSYAIRRPDHYPEVHFFKLPFSVFVVMPVEFTNYVACHLQQKLSPTNRIKYYLPSLPCLLPLFLPFPSLSRVLMLLKGILSMHDTEGHVKIFLRKGADSR